MKRTFLFIFFKCLRRSTCSISQGTEVTRVTEYVSAHKKYFRNFVKLCHMDFVTDVLATFLCVDCGNIIAVYIGSESSQNSSKNILICVLKMNEGLTSLERHEGE